MTEDILSRLARLETRIEVHLAHMLKAIEAERSARIALRVEVTRLDEKRQAENRELRKDREAMIRRFGGWVIYGLAGLVGMLASAVLGIDFPTLR